jgi:hypothetical protein
MNDHADIVRDAIWRSPGWLHAGSLAALDALVAERDEARRERDKALLSVEGLSKRLTIAVAAEAEIVRLRAELGER